MRAARFARSNDAEGVTIFLRGGNHIVSEPIILSAADSGVDARRPLFITAYRDEKPVLSGARRVEGWKRVEGNSNLWQARADKAGSTNWIFRQLFVNGQRKPRARTPTAGFFHLDGPSPQSSPVQFKFKPGEIRGEWTARGDVEIIALLAWADLRMQIRAVDESAQTVTLSGKPRPSNRENKPRYFIENAPDALDSPGEWYLDRRTGLVTYWPEPGENPTRDIITAPAAADLLLAQGDFQNARPVHDVILRGLTFADTDWSLGDEGYADTQAAIATRGNVRFEGAIDCSIENCIFTRLAGYGIELGRGCQRNRIVGNELVDLGAGGLRVGETIVRTNALDLNYGHVITDNHLHRLGRVFFPAVGILILQSGGNRIAHNEINDLFYTAISVGWTWGYRETPCRDNLIEFNHLHDIGQQMLSDMGAIYTLGIQRGTIVRNNLIHDVDSFTYGGWGLYPDEGTSYTLWENNLVYRCKSAGFHQHYGRENIVRNNIFALNREHQLMRTRPEPHLSFFLTNNIVYLNSGDLLGGNWSGENFVLDHNFYFDARRSDGAVTLAGKNLEQWRQQGHDAGSTNVDPMFVAPAKFDFRLRDDSPVLRAGFKPIDLRTVGVRPEKNRR